MSYKNDLLTLNRNILTFKETLNHKRFNRPVVCKRLDVIGALLVVKKAKLIVEICFYFPLINSWNTVLPSSGGVL